MTDALKLDKVEHDYQPKAQAPAAPTRDRGVFDTPPPAVTASTVVTLERTGQPVTLDDLREFVDAAGGLPGSTIVDVMYASAMPSRNEQEFTRIRVES